MLEFITTRYPLGSVLLADLVAELGLGEAEEERYLFALCGASGKPLGASLAGLEAYSRHPTKCR